MCCIYRKYYVCACIKLNAIFFVTSSKPLFHHILFWSDVFASISVHIAVAFVSLTIFALPLNGSAYQFVSTARQKKTDFSFQKKNQQKLANILHKVVCRYNPSSYIIWLHVELFTIFINFLSSLFSLSPILHLSLVVVHNARIMVRPNHPQTTQTGRNQPKQKIY